MKTEDAALLRELLAHQSVGALGTLHRGEPFVSMVPFALLSDRSALVVHVSRLATHTQDMLREPKVSLMVMAAPGSSAMPQGLARVTLQGTATQVTAGDPAHADARTAYLARFPESEPMFGFGDFSLFVIRPAWARVVGGFAQATSVMAPELLEALRQPPPGVS